MGGSIHGTIFVASNTNKICEDIMDMNMNINRKNLKQPGELDIDLESNNRTLNRNFSKNAPLDAQISEEENLKKIPDSDKKTFNYDEKYLNDKPLQKDSCNYNTDDDPGTKLNPNLEKMTPPDPDDQKKINHLSVFNRRNKNQPL